MTIGVVSWATAPSASARQEAAHNGPSVTAGAAKPRNGTAVPTVARRVAGHRVRPAGPSPLRLSCGHDAPNCRLTTAPSSVVAGARQPHRVKIETVQWQKLVGGDWNTYAADVGTKPNRHGPQ